MANRENSVNKIDYIYGITEELLDRSENMDAFCFLRARNALQLRLQQLTNEQLKQMLELLKEQS